MILDLVLCLGAPDQIVLWSGLILQFALFVIRLIKPFFKKPVLVLEKAVKLERPQILGTRNLFQWDFKGTKYTVNDRPDYEKFVMFENKQINEVELANHYVRYLSDLQQRGKLKGEIPSISPVNWREEKTKAEAKANEWEEATRLRFAEESERVKQANEARVKEYAEAILLFIQREQIFYKQKSIVFIVVLSVLALDCTFGFLVTLVCIPFAPAAHVMCVLFTALFIPIVIYRANQKKKVSVVHLGKEQMFKV